MKAPCAYLRSFVEGPKAREDALCLSKIICREPQARGGSGSLSKIICREAPALRKAPGAYLRSFVEGPKAEESPWCLSKIICRGPQS